MHALAKENGVGFHVVVLPIFPDRAPDYTNYPLRDIHKEIGVFLSKQGIPHLDLLDAFAGERKPPAFYSDDLWHPNAEGHLMIARKTLEALIPHDADRTDAASDRAGRHAVTPVAGPPARERRGCHGFLLQYRCTGDSRCSRRSRAQRSASNTNPCACMHVNSWKSRRTSFTSARALSTAAHCSELLHSRRRSSALTALTAASASLWHFACCQ